MSHTLKKKYLNALSLKCLALIFGYGLWHIISQPYKVQTTLTVPLSFYNIPRTHSIAAPETVVLKVYGQRKMLFTAARTTTIHCDASGYTPGTHVVALADQQIFLPEGVSLLHSIPTTVTITVT